MAVPVRLSHYRRVLARVLSEGGGSAVAPLRWRICDSLPNFWDKNRFTRALHIVKWIHKGLTHVEINYYNNYNYLYDALRARA